MSRDPWPRLADAAAMLGLRFDRDAAPGRATLSGRDLRLEVALADDLATWQLAWPLPDALCSGRSAAALLALHDDLALGRLVDEGAGAALVAELPTRDGPMLSAGVGILLDDVARLGGYQAGDAGSPPSAVPPGPVPSAAVGRAVAAWGATSESTPWRIGPAPGGWRCVRAHGAPSRLPAALRLTIAAGLVTATIRRSLAATLAQHAHEACCRFLLAEGEALACRATLGTVGETPWLALASALPSAGFDGADVGRLVRSVCGAMRGLDAIEALCDPELADAFLAVAVPRAAAGHPGDLVGPSQGAQGGARS